MSTNESFSSFLPSRYNTQNPVINLIQIRCSQVFISKISPTSLEYKLFNNLIIFENNQIQLLSKKLVKSSLIDSFQPILQLFNFNCNNFISDLDKLTSNYQISKSQRGSNESVDQYLIITFYFYFLEFILFHKQFLSTRKSNMETSKKQSEVFVKLIQLLNLFGKPHDDVIETIHSYLYIQLILHFLNYDSISNINQMILPPRMECHIDWTQEMYDQCAVQFLIGPVFRMSKNRQNSNQFAYSLILTKFTQISIKSNDTINPTKILEIIYSLLIEQRISFDNIQICSILLPLIQQLNTKAIKIISILSSTSKTLASNIKDDFIQLPPILFQKIMGNAINDYEDSTTTTITTKNNFKPSISKELFLNLNLNEKNFIISKEKVIDSQQQLKLCKTKSGFFKKKHFYKEKNPKAFENGFIAAQSIINVNLIDLFNNQNGINHFLIDFFYSMETANNECLDEFIFAYYKLLSIYQDSDFYFDLYIIGFMFIDKFKDRINLADLFCFLFDSQIFNPNLTIFNNINNKDISIITTIRFNILNTYINENDGILPNFFIKSQNHPLLFSELISYIIQSPNFQNNHSFLQTFITKKFVHSFFKVLNALIYERYELNNDDSGVFSAFQTNLSFLFNLLNDNTKGESLFTLHSFCRKFLSLVFIDTLQNVTLTTIRNLLLSVNPTSIAISPITICISQLLQTIQKVENSEQALNVSINVVQNLVSLLSSNGSISPFFTNIFDFVLNLKHFPNLLEYSLTFTSLISRNIPNFKLKSYQLKRLAHIIAKECKTSDTENSEIDSISDQTYLLLLNLCAATTTLGNSTMFLIKQPTFIPLVFIVFQNSSTKLRNILQNFIDLCNYSISNCFACHFSGIDFLLLEFIYNFKFKKTNKINFRQIEFDLNFTLEDITKYILPFLSLILTYATDSVIISKIIEIINENNNDNDISLTMSSFLLNSITNSKTQLTILHPLGYNIPFFVVDNVNPELLNKRFVFTFWIKIDKLVALSEKDSVEILRISNRKSVYKKVLKMPESIESMQTKEPTNLNISDQISSQNLYKKNKDLLSTTFRLFVKRGVFYYSFNSPGNSPITEEILQNIESNTWLFCAFVTQRSSSENSSACLYSGSHVGYCQDISKIYFPENFPLTISFGGKKIGINSINNDNNNTNADRQIFKPFNLFRNKALNQPDSTEIINNSIKQNEGNLVGVLGPFALFNTLLNEEDLSLLSREGPSLINDDYDGWLIKSTKSSNDFSIQKSILTNVNTIKNESLFVPNSIISEICLHNHIIQLSKPFFNINKAPQKILGTIIGIMKQIFLTSSTLQKEFVYFDIIAKLIISSSIESKESVDQSRINYHLYLNFLSLFECISYSKTSELFFDSLLINVELWYICCNASNFSRIIFHWSHTLVNMYPSFFKRKNFLLKLYKTYFVLFDPNLVKKLMNENDELKTLKSPIFNYSIEEMNECDERFLFLLEEATKLVNSFDNDFLFYFYTIIDLIEKQITFENDIYYQRLKFFLNVLIKNAQKFKVFDDFNKFCFNIVFEEKYSNNPEIVKLAIFAIHELRAPKWFESMSSIGYVVLIHQKINENNSIKWENLIKSLLNDMEFYPGIMHLISYYILNSKSAQCQELKIENENENSKIIDTENKDINNEISNDAENENNENNGSINNDEITKDVENNNNNNNNNEFSKDAENENNESINNNENTKDVESNNDNEISKDAENENNESINNNEISKDVENNNRIEIEINKHDKSNNDNDENTEKEKSDDSNNNNMKITDLEFSKSMNKLMIYVLYQTQDKEIAPVFIKNIISDDYWFLWLLFIAIQSRSEECRQSIMLLISNFVTFSEKIEKELNQIIEVILIINSFIRNIDEYSILLDLFVNILAHGTISMPQAATSLIFSFFFKFCKIFHNNNLINQIELSPLFDKESKIEENETVLIDEEHTIINEFKNFAKKEKKDFVNYKLRFGLTLNNKAEKKISSLEKLYDLLAQTLQIIDYKLTFPGYKKLLEYISIVLKPRYGSKENKIENENKADICNFKFIDSINYFNDTHRSSIINEINEIKLIIERIESIDDFEISKAEQNKPEINFNEIQILSSLFQKTTVNNYFKFITNFVSLDFDSKKDICRDFYSFLFPFKTKLKRIYNVLPIENVDYFDDNEKKLKEISIIKANATFYNFEDEPKEICYILHINNLLSQIIEVKNKIRLYSIPLKSILFINSNKNKIEIYTRNQGSFYLLFDESSDFDKIIRKLNCSSSKDILTPYLSKPMTNYEYLMYLNIISGFSFHDPEKKNKPTFPFIDTKSSQNENEVISEVPVYNFLFEMNQSKNPFLNLEKLELIDDSIIDSYAKNKYKENYFPKFKSELKEMNQQLNKNQNHNETHRIIKDLTLNPDKIRKSGFFHLIKDQIEYELFYVIIKKEGLIHFIQISNEPYIQHFTTQKSPLLIKNKNDDNEDEDAVIIEDFENPPEKEEKDPGILIFSKRMKKLQRITPFKCSSLIDINFELSATLFSSLYSFSYIHQNSSTLMNAIRSSSASFYTSKTSLISSSSTTAAATSTTTASKNKYQHFYHSDFFRADTDLNLFSMCNDELIFVFNKCNIKQTINLNDLLSTKKDEIELKSDNFVTFGKDPVLNSKIVCIASNEKFKALAVGTEKCKVIVYSLISKEVTTIIDLNNKEPEKILITSNFGYIIIEAQKIIFVYNINGQKVGEEEINFDILEWHHSSSSLSASEDNKKEKKGDFVVFMNSVNDIGVFDASHPESMQFVSPSSGLIAAFDYMSFRSYNCIVVVSINYGSIIGFYPVQDFI